MTGYACTAATRHGRCGAPARWNGKRYRCQDHWVAKARCQKHFGLMSRDGSIFFHPVTKQARRWAYKGHGWVELFFYGPGLPPAAFRDEDL